MSYNITSFKINIMNSLVIPVKALYGCNNDWRPNEPQIINSETMEVIITCGCEQSIEGILKDNNIYVTKLNLSGDGSGNLMYESITPAFKKSTGELKGLMIWEGGDSIINYHLKDGIITETDFDFE